MDDSDQIPQLMVIPKQKQAQKKIIQTVAPNNTTNLPVVFQRNVGLSQTPRTANNAEIKIADKNVKPEPSQVHVNELKNLFDAMKETNTKIPQNKTNKQISNSKSKKLIDELMDRISVKNITQQLYPVSNETIDGFVQNLRVKIDNLTVQVQHKRKNLQKNKDNAHLRGEVNQLQVQINQCVIMKQLYLQKVNMRNKITSLERQIINLKEENRALVIKIKQGIEAVENHMHNLPCEKEKELKQALHRCQINLDKEMEMRKSLEKNVAETMMNFNRLFEEAEIARQIVIKKLKDIQIREKAVRSKQEQESIISSADLALKSAQRKATEQQQKREHQQSGTIKKGMSSPLQTRMVSNDNSNKTLMKMQDQIKKMRANQILFAKTSR